MSRQAPLTRSLSTGKNVSTRRLADEARVVVHHAQDLSGLGATGQEEDDAVDAGALKFVDHLARGGAGVDRHGDRRRVAARRPPAGPPPPRPPPAARPPPGP